MVFDLFLILRVVAELKLGLFKTKMYVFGIFLPLYDQKLASEPEYVTIIISVRFD